MDSQESMILVAVERLYMGLFAMDTMTDLPALEEMRKLFPTALPEQPEGEGWQLVPVIPWGEKTEHWWSSLYTMFTGIDTRLLARRVYVFREEMGVTMPTKPYWKWMQPPVSLNERPLEAAPRYTVEELIFYECCYPWLKDREPATSLVVRRMGYVDEEGGWRQVRIERDLSQQGFCGYRLVAAVDMRPSHPGEFARMM